VSGYEVTACAHGGRARCWPCQTDGCYETPSLHPWWDDEDVEHAAATGQSAPFGWCGCAFCGEPAARRETGTAKANRLVRAGSRVAMVVSSGHEHGRGKVVGYYDHPTYIVQLDSGEQVAWSERLVCELRDGAVQ
jgi:hypothetical protein